MLGDGKVSGVRLRDVQTGELSDLPATGVFVAIGHAPNTDVFRGQIDMDENGYINTHDGTAQRLISDPSLFNNLNDIVCQISRMMPRVVWGLPVTIDIFSPTRRFSSVDFPEFGRPMIDTKPDRDRSSATKLY